jgi:CheY-like chemotaxis protein
MNDKEAILLVEDNEDDVFLMRRAIEKAAIANPLFVVEDGQQAIDYLSGTERFGDRTAFPLPALIFLDLKLPGKKGLEVLEWLRKQETLRRVVVVILTSSQEPNDLRRAYDLGANSFLVKPARSERLEAMVKAVKEYWLEFNMFDSTRG